MLQQLTMITQISYCTIRVFRSVERRTVRTPVACSQTSDGEVIIVIGCDGRTPPRKILFAPPITTVKKKKKSLVDVFSTLC